jgi:hypothetical protein
LSLPKNESTLACIVGLMSSFELYKKIRKLDNKVKICFLTAGELYYEEVENKCSQS